MTPRPVVGRRMLNFPDGTQVAVSGLDTVMAELHAEGRPANIDTAEEIVRRLEEKKNYIPSSVTVRREYAYALRQEYSKYSRDQSNHGG